VAIYFTNYCPNETADRASETRVHSRLRDARAFMENRRGYIIRQAEPDHPTGNGANTFQEWCGGFTATAQDEENIRNALEG